MNNKVEVIAYMYVYCIMYTCTCRVSNFLQYGSACNHHLLILSQILAMINCRIMLETLRLDTVTLRDSGRLPKSEKIGFLKLLGGMYAHFSEHYTRSQHQ
jgi:hypothetical protein